MNTPIHKFRVYLSKQANLSKERDNEQDIVFGYNGLSLVFESYYNDPYYYRIVIPKIFDINDSNKQWVVEEINNLSGKIKAVRLYIDDGKVWAVADGFVYSSENIDYLFSRMLSCLDTLFNQFKNDYFAWQKNKTE